MSRAQGSPTYSKIEAVQQHILVCAQAWHLMGSDGGRSAPQGDSYCQASATELLMPRFTRRPATSQRRMAHVFSAPFFEIHNGLDAAISFSVSTHPNHGVARPFSGGGASRRPAAQVQTVGPGISTSFTLARGTVSAYVSTTCKHPQKYGQSIMLKRDQLVNNLDVITID